MTYGTERENSRLTHYLNSTL